MPSTATRPAQTKLSLQESVVRRHIWTPTKRGVPGGRLKLMAVHPDRTGGLGALSDVQTSFAIIIFGTGILLPLQETALFEPVGRIAFDGCQEGSVLRGHCFDR